MSLEYEKLKYYEIVGEWYHSHNKDLDATYLQFPDKAESTIRRQIRQYNEIQTADKEKELIIKENDTEATVTGTAESAEELFEKSGLNPEVWEMHEIEQKDNYWDVHMKLKNSVYQSHTTTHVEKRTNRQYYIKIKCRRISDIIDWDKFKREFIEDTINLTRSIKKIKYTKIPKEEKNLLEINIFDLHLGKLGWHEETGSMSYDVKIAEERFMEGLRGLVKKAKGFKIDEILFPIGNDFFNSDTAFPSPTTTRGTPQQDDLRWQQIFRNGRVLIMKGIDYLQTIAPITIKVIPGNHDFARTFYLGDVLEVAYEKNPNVTVDNSPNPHKFFVYGSNLIGFTHGNTKDIPLPRLITLMPILVPKLWANSKFREWHLGDIHHKKVWKLKGEDDEGGVNIRYMRSLSGDDAWHHSKGYKGTIKGCEAYIWDYSWGLSANINYNIITEL